MRWLNEIILLVMLTEMTPIKNGLPLLFCFFLRFFLKVVILKSTGLYAS